MSGGSYHAPIRRELQRALQDGAELICPDCTALLSRHAVPVPPTVAYVRRRVLVICPICHRSAALDLPTPADGRP
jgi:hypothetical protein